MSENKKRIIVGNVVVKETAEEKEARETVGRIAENIASLAKSVQALIGGPLKRRALIILLANSSGIAQTNVEKVIRGLETLEADWLNKQ